MSDKINQTTKEKTISVSIIGRPNAGKSTLMNYFVGQKLSITTPKIQTTRTIITGIVTSSNTQIVFFDTPGIFVPKSSKLLEKIMVKTAWSTINNSDIVIVIIDSLDRLDDRLKNIIKRILEHEKDIIFLLNKIDKSPKYYVDHLSYIEEIKRNHKDRLNIEIFNISALVGTGVDLVLEYIKSKAHEGNWVYEEDDITNLPIRFLASEITREHLFNKLNQELPYELAVYTYPIRNGNNRCDNEFNNTACSDKNSNKSNILYIQQDIITNREGHKKIIIGHKGQMIKNIGMLARKDIEKLADSKIFLEIFVKVRKNWTQKNDSINQFVFGL